MHNGFNHICGHMTGSARKQTWKCEVECLVSSDSVTFIELKTSYCVFEVR